MGRIEVDGTIVVFDCLAEVLSLAGLPPVRMKQISLSHRILLGENSVIEGG